MGALKLLCRTDRQIHATSIRSTRFIICRAFRRNTCFAVDHILVHYSSTTEKRAGGHRLPLCFHTDKAEAVSKQTEDQDPQQRSETAAATAGYCRAAQNHSGDYVQLKACSRIGFRGCNPRREDD